MDSTHVNIKILYFKNLKINIYIFLIVKPFIYIYIYIHFFEYVTSRFQICSFCRIFLPRFRIPASAPLPKGANIQVAHVQSMATSLDALQAGWRHRRLLQWTMKKTLGYLMYIGDYTTQLNRDYFINHEIRIPMNQPSVMILFHIILMTNAPVTLQDCFYQTSLTWSCMLWTADCWVRTAWLAVRGRRYHVTWPCGKKALALPTYRSSIYPGFLPVSAYSNTTQTWLLSQSATWSHWFLQASRNKFVLTFLGP